MKDESYCGRPRSQRVVNMDLDDMSAISKVDRSRMLAVMNKTPERLSPPRDATSTFGESIERPNNVVFGGVGGSGIIGDIVADYLRGISQVPVSVCKSFQLPAYAGKETLFVAISYSGETQETLSLLNQAQQKMARVVTVGSGGTLLNRSRQEQIGYLKVPEGLLPRVALPEMVAATMFVMGSAGLIKEVPRLLRDSAEALRAQIHEIEPNVPLQRNKAKQMAQAMLDRLPLLVGSEDTGSVLRRFKNELNENSKMPAFYYTLPEGYHNDLEGLKMLGKLAKPQTAVLRQQDEGDAQRRTREQLYSLFEVLGFPPVLEFKGLGENRWQQLLTALTFGDYVSVYLALLRRVDPSELMLIPKFRQATRAG